MAETMTPLAGVINLDKPPGLTSARAVDRVKRVLPKGTKIGHAGTLDPFATGVLLLLVGKATKSCETLMGERKGYEAEVKLGARTATDDLEAAEEPVEVGVYLTELRRTFVGRFRAEEAVSLETLQADGVERHLHAV